MITRAIVVSMFGTNCYIVGSEATNKGMIIDPGGEPDLIFNTIKKLGLSISLIVITHVHADHIER